MLQLWQTILDADWAWRIAAWVLLASALVLLPWALFWDRPGWRGRPREWCRRCRYDMTGVPGEASITCPECGRVARSRRALRKTRRRWGMTTLALFPLCAWHLILRKEHIRYYGWHYALPNEALIFLVPPNRWADRHIRLLPSVNPSMLGDELSFELDTIDDWAVDLWLWRVRRTPGTPIVVRDLSELIPVEVDLYTPYDCFIGMFYPPRDRASTDDRSVYNLIELIQLSIEPERWRDWGGSDWAIDSVKNRLVISAPRHVTAQIGEIISALEAEAAWQSPTPRPLPDTDLVILVFPLEDALRGRDWIVVDAEGEYSEYTNWYTKRLTVHNNGIGTLWERLSPHPGPLRQPEDFDFELSRIDDLCDDIADALEFTINGTTEWIDSSPVRACECIDSKIVVVADQEQAGRVAEVMETISQFGPEATMKHYPRPTP